ncbi:MAG: hypothetical protein AABX70_01080 [Nanoarchaeota archaeon]
MPRILEGSELEEVVRFMSMAVELSASSPCERDKRGVVIVKDGRKIGQGVNAPPPGFRCEPRYCQSTCRTYAVHAEMGAIANAMSLGNDVRGARMYHARGDKGQLVDSRQPRCADCSKHVLAFGLAEFVLKHAEGYTVYGAEEFNRLSLENQRKRDSGS